jgi:hypothetical protein
MFWWPWRQQHGRRGPTQGIAVRSQGTGRGSRVDWKNGPEDHLNAETKASRAVTKLVAIIAEEPLRGVPDEAIEGVGAMLRGPRR